MLRYLRLLCLAPLAAVLPGEASAAATVTVVADQSTPVTLAAPPATVVVGNPSIADVTLDGQTMFVHGRGTGLTNILVLGANGGPIADYQVHVVYGDPDTVAVYSPTGRETYSCPGDCEPVLRIGDSTEFFKSAADQIKAKAEIAANQALAGAQPQASPAVTTPAP
jgi:hypothetical protein